MNTTQINGDALRRAVSLIYGPEAVDVMARVYVALDDAQQAAYNQGLADGHANGYAMGQETAEERVDAAFDNGYMHGQSEGEAMGEAEADAREAKAFDNGYLDGVRDARANPTMADETVQDIVNDQAREYYSAVDEDEDCEDWWADGIDYEFEAFLDDILDPANYDQDRIISGN